MRLLLSLLVACQSDYSPSAANRVLDGYSYVDAGAVAVGERQPFTAPVFSRGDGAVKIFEIATEDVSIPEGAEPGVFAVSDAEWAAEGCDRDEDGAADCIELAAYNAESDDDTLPLSVTFKPTVEGYYEGLLTIWSNDTQTTQLDTLPDDPDGDNFAVWKVQLRGLARYACGRTWPAHIDFGKKAAGGDFTMPLTVVNCGVVTLVISKIDVATPSASMSSLTSVPLYVLAGDSEEVSIGWHVGGQDPVNGTVSFVGNSESLASQAVTVIGNDCANSVDTSWDADSDGWFSCGGDCDDNATTGASINPGASENSDNEKDDDCDGAIDEADDTPADDADGDGCNESGSLCAGVKDCDDDDDQIGPHATEVPYNQVDDDCNGIVDDLSDWYDDDGDGASERSGDCDDANQLVAPTGTETQDGLDNDCDGIVDEGGIDYDDDEDGYKDVESDPALSDCSDADPWSFVGADEYCDGYDNDCDGLVDEGPDDEDEGACDFRGARSAGEDTGVVETAGCATADSPGNVLLALGAALSIRRRFAR